MGSFGNTVARMRMVQGMMDRPEELVTSDSGQFEKGQIQSLDPWRTFLCFNDPRSRWSLQREAYAGLIAQGVNFSFRDGGVITAAGLAVHAVSQGLCVSTAGVEWRTASGVDLYIAAKRLKIKGWFAPKKFENHAEPFFRSASLVQKMLDRDPNFPFLDEWDGELVPSLFADRSLRGLRRSSMRVAADSMAEQASRSKNENFYRDPKWMQVQHQEESERWRSGWRDMCSEWFLLMLINRVPNAEDYARDFIEKCENHYRKLGRVLPLTLKYLEQQLQEVRQRQLEME